MTTAESREAILGVVRECVEMAGPSGLPSGHFYSLLMTIIPDIDLTTYNAMIAMAVKAGKVSLNNHVLTIPK